MASTTTTTATTPTHTHVKEERNTVTLQIQYESSGVERLTRSFETSKDDPLRRIMLDFCDSLDLVYGSIKFFVDGQRLHETDTARQREMDDGDVIDAFSDQIGGAGTGLN